MNEKALHDLVNRKVTALSKLKGKIGVYGGTFDPVQNAHIEIIQSALADLNLDHVIVIPARHNPLKTSLPRVSDADRLVMLALGTEKLAEVTLSRIELDRKDSEHSYTIDTIRELKSRLPQAAEIFFLAGSDNLATLPMWKDVNSLLSILDSFVVYRRASSNASPIIIPKALPKSAKEKITAAQIKSEIPAISSTEVRELLANAQTRHKAIQFLPSAVYDYIQAHNLYTV